MKYISRIYNYTLIIGLLWAGSPLIPAWAHAFLVQTSPAASARLIKSPRQLTLDFTEAIVPTSGNAMMVKNNTGQTFLLRDIHLSHGHSTLVATLPPLPVGMYTVDWSVVSALDGHPSQGEYTFAVGTGGTLPNASLSPSSSIVWPDALSSFILFAGLALGIGVLVSRRWIWRDPPQVTRHSPIFLPVLLAWFASIAQLLLFLLRTHPGGSTGWFSSATWRILLQSPTSFWMLCTFFLLTYAWATLLLYRQGRRQRTVLLSLIAAALAAALRTHPAASGHWWAILAIAIHIVVAIGWVGLLVHLVWVMKGWRDRLSSDTILAAVRHYTAFAMASVGLLVVTGVLAALTQFTRINELVATEYGRTLLVKSGLFAIVLSLAWFAHQTIFRRKATHSLSRFWRIISLEATFLTLVLAASAVLANTAPPQPSIPTSLTQLLGPGPVTGPVITWAATAGWLNIYATASDGQLTLQVSNPVSNTPTGIRLVTDDSKGNSLFAHTPSGQVIGLAPRTCGDGCFSTPFHWPRGTTQLTLDITSAQWQGGRVSFPITWPPLPNDNHRLPLVLAAMDTERYIVVREQVSSGTQTYPWKTFRMSGKAFMATEPYSAHVTDVRPLHSHGALREYSGYEAGSQIWFHLWLNVKNQIIKETIIAPGHLVLHRFTYPK